MKRISSMFKPALALLATLTLASCSAIGRSTPTPLPTVVLGTNVPAPTATGAYLPQGTGIPQSSGATSGSGVTASGIVVPEQDAGLAFTLGGTVKSVNVSVGDQVNVGQVLVTLDTTDLQIAVNQARRNFQELTSPAAVAAAELAQANAQQAVKDTNTKVVGLKYPRASDALIQNTEGQIDLAREALAEASNAWRSVQHRPDGDPDKAAALVAMTNAQLNLNKLIANVNWYQGKPSDIDTAIAYANLDAAKAALNEATWYLALLKGQTVPPEATGPKLVALEEAITTLVTAERQLDDAQLITRIPGTIISVDVIPGQIVTPGELLVQISNVTKLHVETTDLSERDVPRVQVGQPVQVFVKALNQSVAGRVRNISPVADILGGDVVYKTYIDLDANLTGLRAGMSVEVRF